MNVLMLYPKFSGENFWHASRSNKLFLRRGALMPPLGLLTIASYLPEDFHIRLIDRNLADESEQDWNWADVVFLSLMVVQQEDYRVCVRNARGRGKAIAVGGPFTHAMPEMVTADADWVCFGEAEDIMEEFVEDLKAGRKGRQYQGGNKTNMALVKTPRFDLVPQINQYTTMAIQFSRGCPFRCEFCDIIEIYGRVPRTKTPLQIFAELADLKGLGFRGYVFLVDDNFIGNKKNAKALLAELAIWNRGNGYPFRFYTEASINLADDRQLLEGMARANFFFVFIGIETPDPKLLKTTLKLQNLSGNPLEKLRQIREYGIHITAGFIVGFDGEERGIFETQRSFIAASGIGVAMAGLLVAIPHTQLARRLRKEGRLLDKIWSGEQTTEGINFIPKGEMAKREYLQRYCDLIKDIFEPKAYLERILPALLTTRSRAPLRAIYQTWRINLPVLVRIMYQFGVKSRATRFSFWKVFLRVALKNPAAVEAFGYDCLYLHHLSQHADYVERKFSRYLAAPDPDDVLDAVVGFSNEPQPVIGLRPRSDLVA